MPSSGLPRFALAYMKGLQKSIEQMWYKPSFKETLVMPGAGIADISIATLEPAGEPAEPENNRYQSW